MNLFENLYEEKKPLASDTDLKLLRIFMVRKNLWEKREY